MTDIRVNYDDGKIVLSSAFAKRAFNAGTTEYMRLQSVRNDHPGFAVVTRKFKTSTTQEHYRGLTYSFMREYISTHEKEAEKTLAEFDEMIGVSKCHSLSKRYPTIKAWFLERYPAIAEFGMPDAKTDGADIAKLPCMDEKIPA